MLYVFNYNVFYTILENSVTLSCDPTENLDTNNTDKYIYIYVYRQRKCMILRTKQTSKKPLESASNPIN
jgi:phage regulator Rha-like protein